MTVPVPGPTVRAQVLGEAAAALGAGCIALHLVAAASPGHGGGPVAVLLVAMAAACVPCVRGLWRGPTVRTWAMTGGMYAAMLAAHLLVLTGPGGGAAAAPAHVHTGALTWTELAMWSGLGLAGVQVALAAAVLLVRSAQARPASSASSDGAGPVVGSGTRAPLPSDRHDAAAHSQPLRLKPR